MLRHMMLRVKVISRIALRFDAARKDESSHSEEDGTIRRFHITSDLVATMHHTTSYGATRHNIMYRDDRHTRSAVIVKVTALTLRRHVQLHRAF